MSAAPSTLYQPVPVEIVNFDFEASPGTLPPTGWQTGGLAPMSAAATLSYDTTTPYEGNYSLVITATAYNAGVSSIQAYPVAPGQVYLLQAAMKSISADQCVMQVNFYNKNGNLITAPIPNNGISYAPFVATAIQEWQLYSVQGTVPLGAVTAQIQLWMAGLSGGTGEFDVVQLTLVSVAIPYYLNRITSEYQNSPNFLALLGVLLQPFVDIAICAFAMTEAFDIQEAVGDQLDVLGVILGRSRTLPFSPLGISATSTNAVTAPGNQFVDTNNTTYMEIGKLVTVAHSGDTTDSVSITGVIPGIGFSAFFTHTHQLGSTVTGVAPSAVLDDAHYQLLLQATVLFNNFKGQYMGAYGTLWQAWKVLFPGGAIYITDNQNMTATLFVVGQFDALTQQMITNGLIVPRCQAVKFIYEFGTLPIFGFGNLNPSFIQGFGNGSGTYPGGNWA